MNDNRLDFVMFSSSTYDPFVEYNQFDAVNPDDIYIPETIHNRRKCEYVGLEEFGKLGISNSYVHSFLKIKSIPKKIGRISMRFLYC